MGTEEKISDHHGAYRISFRQWQNGFLPTNKGDVKISTGVTPEAAVKVLRSKLFPLQIEVAGIEFLGEIVP